VEICHNTQPRAPDLAAEISAMSTDSFDPAIHGDPLQFWENRVKASRWMITKTAVLGAFAGALGILGQGWLEQAAPLFPIISQNFGIWQLSYLLALIIIFLIWALAMRQKMGLLENSRKGMATQQRIAQHTARRKQATAEARQRRAEAEKIREREAAAKRGDRSKKFEY
jgi:H+/Cl- antiporter ClcA